METNTLDFYRKRDLLKISAPGLQHYDALIKALPRDEKMALIQDLFCLGDPEKHAVLLNTLKYAKPAANLFARKWIAYYRRVLETQVK